MNSRVLLFAFLITTANVFGQDKHTEAYKTELSQYIDRMKPGCSANGEYAIYFTHFNSLEKNKFCFDIELLCNEHDLKDFCSNYFFRYRNEIVLVCISKEDSVLINELHLKKTDENDLIKIKGKLFPANKGMIMSEEKIGFHYCDENGNVKKGIHNDSFYWSLPPLK